MPQNNLQVVQRPALKVKAVKNPNGITPVSGLPSVKRSFNPAEAVDPAFQKWYSRNTLEGQAGIPYDDKQVYDYLSFYKNGEYKNTEYGIDKHFPDTYKRPSHPTFSNESIYSTPEKPGGSWGGSDGETYNPKGKFQYNLFPSGGELPVVDRRQWLMDRATEDPRTAAVRRNSLDPNFAQRQSDDITNTVNTIGSFTPAWPLFAANQIGRSIDKGEYRQAGLDAAMIAAPNIIGKSIKHIMGYLPQNRVAGINWLKDWYNNPVTVGKIKELQQYDHIPGGDAGIPYSEYVHPGKRFSPEDINRLKQPKSDYAMQSHSNWDKVSGYDAKTNQPIIEYGDTQVGWGFHDQKATTIHEGTHQITHNGGFFNDHTKDLLQQGFKKTPDEIIPSWNGEIDRTYFANPTEIHSRINEIRNELSLTPADIITPNMMSKILRTSGGRDMKPYITNKKLFLETLNKMPAVVPIAATIALERNKTK